MRYEKSALTIQRYWRGYLVRRDEIKRIKKIVKVQSCVRRWLAKRRLRELKVNKFRHLLKFNNTERTVFYCAHLPFLVIVTILKTDILSVHKEGYLSIV